MPMTPARVWQAIGQDDETLRAGPGRWGGVPVRPLPISGSTTPHPLTRSGPLAGRMALCARSFPNEHRHPRAARRRAAVARPSRSGSCRAGCRWRTRTPPTDRRSRPAGDRARGRRRSPPARSHRQTSVTATGSLSSPAAGVTLTPEMGVDLFSSSETELVVAASVRSSGLTIQITRA